MSEQLLPLTRFETGNLKRLQGCIKPVKVKIERLKQKLALAIAKTQAEISQLESDIEEYSKLIAPLEARLAANPTQDTSETVEDAGAETEAEIENISEESF